MNKNITDISEEFMTALVSHSWPGNVRELQNFIERSVILSKGGVLNGLPPELTSTKPSVPVTLDEADRLHILQTLQETAGVIGGPNGAATRLGLCRTTLISKMKRLGIHRGASSTLPTGTAASVPISEELSQKATSLENINPEPDPGRLFTLRDAEREHISDIETNDGLIAAEGGAVPPSTLQSRMQKLGMNVAMTGATR
jgi:hypothetical protein